MKSVLNAQLNSAHKIMSKQILTTILHGTYKNSLTI